MGNHHCPTCTKPLSSLCVKRTHVVKCPMHNALYMPGGRCASCHEAEVRHANLESKRKMKEAKKAEEAKKVQQEEEAKKKEEEKKAMREKHQKYN